MRDGVRIQGDSDRGRQAKVPPPRPAEHPLLALQRAAGNGAVQRLISEEQRPSLTPAAAKVLRGLKQLLVNARNLDGALVGEAAREYIAGDNALLRDRAAQSAEVKKVIAAVEAELAAATPETLADRAPTALRARLNAAGGWLERTLGAAPAKAALATAAEQAKAAAKAEADAAVVAKSRAATAIDRQRTAQAHREKITEVLRHMRERFDAFELGANRGAYFGSDVHGSPPAGRERMAPAVVDAIRAEAERRGWRLQPSRTSNVSFHKHSAGRGEDFIYHL